MSTGLVERNPLVTLINTARLILVLFVVALIQLIDVNVIQLQILGIAVSAYAIGLLALPFDRTRSKHLGYLICLLDASFIIAVVSYSGDFVSPFLILFLFPLISLSILYESRGAFAAVFIFLLYAILNLTQLIMAPVPDTEVEAIRLHDAILSLFVNMSLLSFFAVYLGNIGKSIKARGELQALREELDRLKAQAGA